MGNDWAEVDGVWFSTNVSNNSFSDLKYSTAYFTEPWIYKGNLCEL